MIRISINLYSIGELSKKAQEQAFQKYQYYNITEFNWYESTYDDFISICRETGILVSYKDISFSGFWSQEDGSTFSSIVEPLKFIDGMGKKAWKEYTPSFELDVNHCPCNNRVISLIRAGHIIGELHTRMPDRGYGIIYQSEYSFSQSHKKPYPNIERELKKLDVWIEHCLNMLNKHLYSSLEKTHEYLISNEALTENFMIDQCLFTQDGHMADRIFKLSIDELTRKPNKMTRANLHVTLSNGKSIKCVAESSSAPEQGYIVEQLILPLLALDDSEKELELLSEHCTMDERRANATYRYTIDLTKKEVRLFEENFNYRNETFHKGKEITKRYNDYLESLDR